MKILIYIPLKDKSFLNLWEYYKVDINILNTISSKSYVSTSFLSFLKFILRSDYVYCWWWHSSLPVLIFSKLLRKKIITTGAIHMFDYSGETTFFKKGFFHKLFCKISLKFSDANIFISEDQKNQITSHLKVNNFFTVYSSLNENHTSLYNNIAEDKYIREEKNFAFISWLTKANIKRKGLIQILQALELLHQQDFTFYICGKKGDGYELLLNIINKLKIKNKIKLLIDISEEKDDLLKIVDLYLQPSFCEGLGNAVIEAMSRGCVPLVSRFASQPEIVGTHGIIINDINHIEISNKILDYLKLSPQERFKNKQKILDYCHEKFSYKKHLEKYKEIFESI